VTNLDQNRTREPANSPESAQAAKVGHDDEMASAATARKGRVPGPWSPGPWLISLAALLVSLLVLGVSSYSLYRTVSADRPRVVVTGWLQQAVDYDITTGPGGHWSPDQAIIDLGWFNVGKCSAFRLKFTVFMVSDDGKRRELLDRRDLGSGPFLPDNGGIVLDGGGGPDGRPMPTKIDLNKFLGLFLVCPEYDDDENHRDRVAKLVGKR